MKLSAEAVGIMEKLVELTSEHLRVRATVQFTDWSLPGAATQNSRYVHGKRQSKSMLYYAAIETAEQTDGFEDACAML
ncbi:MAG: hypothetical protein ACFHHU_18585 [Porticoccaceae bacterium]